MEPVDEQRSLRLPDSTTLPADRVQFAEEVAVIHPGAIPVTRGRPKVSVRKLYVLSSLPLFSPKPLTGKLTTVGWSSSLSFGPKPTATDVEDRESLSPDPGPSFRPPSSAFTFPHCRVPSRR